MLEVSYDAYLYLIRIVYYESGFFDSFINVIDKLYQIKIFTNFLLFYLACSFSIAKQWNMEEKKLLQYFLPDSL